MFGFQGIQLDGYHYCCPTLYLRNPQNQMLRYSSHLQKTGYSVFVGWEWAGQAVLAFSSIPSHVYFIAAEMCSPVKSCMSCRAHHGCMSRRARYRLTIWTWSREAGPLTGPLFFVFLHFALHFWLQNLNSWTFERTVLHFSRFASSFGSRNARVTFFTSFFVSQSL